jgi:hypothetical protein
MVELLGEVLADIQDATEKQIASKAFTVSLVTPACCQSVPVATQNNSTRSVVLSGTPFGA